MQGMCALFLSFAALSFVFATGHYLELVKRNQTAVLVAGICAGYLVTNPPRALDVLGQQISTLFALFG